MSSITIAALVGGGIIAVILLVYISQYRQRTADTRQRLVNTLQDRHRQFALISSSLPPAFISPEVKAVLATRAISTLEELGRLGRPSDYQDQIEEWKTYLDNANNPPEGNKTIANGAAVQEIRRLLKVLYRFIESQMKKGRLDKATGTRNLENTLYLMAKVLGDAHVVKAKAALKSERYRVAIHHYHDAVAAYAKLPNNALAQKTVLLYRQQIKELEKQATTALQSKNATATSQTTDTRLAAQMDEIVSKEDTWKKKQAYDD